MDFTNFTLLDLMMLKGGVLCALAFIAGLLGYLNN